MVDGQLFQEKMIMAKCRICGHNSHCDEKFMKFYIKNANKEILDENIECKYCRCEKCAWPDWG